VPDVMAVAATRMNTSNQGRSRARRLALQALYQWDLSGLDVNDIESQFLETQDFTAVDREYFLELLHAVPAHRDEIESRLTPSLTRTMREVDPVERAILRIAGYELVFRKEIPYRVVINEAVVLARKFGAEQGHAFVNAVLDSASRTLRSAERKGAGRDTI
jgi:N utilization substance protein B